MVKHVRKRQRRHLLKNRRSIYIRETFFKKNNDKYIAKSKRYP